MTALHEVPAGCSLTLPSSWQQPPHLRFVVGDRLEVSFQVPLNLHFQFPLPARPVQL